ARAPPTRAGRQGPHRPPADARDGPDRRGAAAAPRLPPVRLRVLPAAAERPPRVRRLPRPRRRRGVDRRRAAPRGRPDAPRAVPPRRARRDGADHPPLGGERRVLAGRAAGLRPPARRRGRDRGLVLTAVGLFLVGVLVPAIPSGELGRAVRGALAGNVGWAAYCAMTDTRSPRGWRRPATPPRARDAQPSAVRSPAGPNAASDSALSAARSTRGSRASARLTSRALTKTPRPRGRSSPTSTPCRVTMSASPASTASMTAALLLRSSRWLIRLTGAA